MSRIILASSSTYRKSLLERLQLKFDIAIPDVDESAKPNEKPEELVTRLAISKVSAVSIDLLNAVIIGSDQVAVCDNQILGKPGNKENAIDQLKFISGKQVTFHTGLCVLNTSNEQLQSDVVNCYLKKEPAFNCAGSFKSEGLGIGLTNRIFGDDPTALIGLPLIRLIQMLENTGIKVI